jgi:hypothetical protein
MRLLALFAALAALLLAAPAAAQAPPATLDPVAEDPVTDKTTVLQLTLAGLPATGYAVVARYRENAHETLKSTQEIGTTDAEGKVDWVPERPGVVVLAWEQPGVEGTAGKQNISVVYDGAPIGAVIIALFAGLMLLGGSVAFFVQMIREGKRTAGRELPST